jgi:hypothetical protein
LNPDDVILLDGAEQMSWSAWQWFRIKTRPTGGLIITTHRSGRFPTLIQSFTTPELLRGIVSELLAPQPLEPGLGTHQLFQRHRGNLRAALRELYDTYAGR